MIFSNPNRFNLMHRSRSTNHPPLPLNRRKAVGFSLACAGLALLLATPMARSAPERVVVQLDVDGVINPVIARYVEEGIRNAESREAAAVLIRLDTPGGLLDATRQAITAIINAPIPVIVYVGPRGARATSAGLFIAMASDVAAMAPETHLGAAHPVTITGDSPRPRATERKTDENGKEGESGQTTGSVMEEKMTSDAAAYIRALAAERGRNAVWAERAVRESVSLTSKEALEKNVIELIADSPRALLDRIDGRIVTKGGDELELAVKGAEIVELEMSWTDRLLHMLAHPNVAYILMTIGIYGLIYEFASPGLGVGGIAGVISLLIAFFALQVLPINAVGLLLIAFGVLLMVADLFTPTNGLLTLGGLIAFAFGSFMLIDVDRDLTVPRVSPALIIPTVVCTGAFFAFAIRKIFDARRQAPVIGTEALVGRTAIVREALDPEGLIFLDGELWTARSEVPVQPGDTVVVRAQKGNVLVVSKN